MLNEDTSGKIIMQGIHLELTDAMRNAITEKFSPLLRHNHRIIRINVRLRSAQKLGQQDHLYSATGEIEIGGPNLISTAEGTEAYNVLDALAEKLGRLLQDLHGQRKDKRNHPHDVELESTLPKTGKSPADESED